MTLPATCGSSGSHKQSRDQLVVQVWVCGRWASSTEEHFSPQETLRGPYCLQCSLDHEGTFPPHQGQENQKQNLLGLLHFLSTINNSYGAKSSSWVKGVMGVNRPDYITGVPGMQKKNADCLFTRVSIHLHGKLHSSLYSEVGGLRGSCLVCMEIPKWSIKALQWTLHGLTALGLICVLQR